MAYNIIKQNNIIKRNYVTVQCGRSKMGIFRFGSLTAGIKNRIRGGRYGKERADGAKGVKDYGI